MNKDREKASTHQNKGLNIDSVISRQFNVGDPVKWAGSFYYVKKQDELRVLVTGTQNIEDESYNDFWLNKTDVR